MADMTGTATKSPTRFLDRQLNTYGMPQTSSPYMPNGQPQAAPQQPSYYQPAVQPQQQTQTQTGNVDQSGVYHAVAPTTYQYQPQQVQQFQAPSYPQIQQQQQGMVQGLLNNPYSLSPQIVSQMKGQNADQAALLARQNIGQLKSQLAARGIATDQGMGLGQQRAVLSNMDQNVLNNNRQIDLQANQQNRQDLLQALGMADQFQNSTLNRAITGYQANLAGLGANRDEATTAMDQQMKAYQAALQGQQLASQSQLGAIGNQLQGQSLANQANQFGQTFGLDTQKFDYQKQLDAQQLAMQQASQAASNSNFQDQLAFQYQQANQNSYNNMLAYLMSGGQ